MHLAIILDGNRRYASKHNKRYGHAEGAKKVSELITWAHNANVKELSLYCFSTENFKRSEKEKDYLMRLFTLQFTKLLKDHRINDYDVRLNFAGNLSLFPEHIKKRMYQLMEQTKNRTTYTINFCMAYGGRQELVHVMQTLGNHIKEGTLNPADITQDTITTNLWVRSEPDLVIRPGGEQRTSNFLLWQSYYAEWYFTQTLWPEFTEQELLKAINSFKERQRRYGN